MMRARVEVAASAPALTTTTTLGVLAMAKHHVSAHAGAINAAQFISPILLIGTLAQAMRCAVLSERNLAAISALDAEIDASISTAEAAWGDAKAAATSILARAEHLPDVVVLIAAIVEQLVTLRDEEAGEEFMQQIHDRRADLWLAACRTGDLQLQRRLAWAIDALQDMRALETFGGIATPQGPCPVAPALSENMDLAAA